MIPLDSVAPPQLAEIWNRASRVPSIHDVERRCDVFSSNSRHGSPHGKDDMVVTPGGPRRRDQVHRVGPGETVRRNADGTYTVVPKEAPADAKQNEELKKKEK